MKFEIEKFNACKDAILFRANYPTFKEAWKACPRGDWMLWIAKKLDVAPRTLTLAKAKCAATVLHLMKDNRSKEAIKVAIAFGEGSATEQELKNAAYAAAAYAATDAADAAAYAAAYAATDAADAAAAAYAATDAADAAAARKQNQKSTADLCREILTTAVFEKLNIAE